MPIVYKNKQIVTVSESSKKDIVKLGFGKSSNIHIVHNGIDQETFGLSDKTAWPLFTYLGRLKPYKNIDVAIRAFATISTNYPNAKLAILGDGESKNKLIDLTKELGLERNVRFYGKVSEEKKAEILAQSWAVLQPSMTEGWGITVIEANASGTPVIASNVNGLKDSVINGKTGILVDVKDTDAFITAMTDILVSKEYRKDLSRNAVGWAQNFNWDLSKEKFLYGITTELTKNRDRSGQSEFIFLKEQI